MAYVRF